MNNLQYFSWESKLFSKPNFVLLWHKGLQDIKRDVQSWSRQMVKKRKGGYMGKEKKKDKRNTYFWLSRDRMSEGKGCSAKVER